MCSKCVEDGLMTPEQAEAQKVALDNDDMDGFQALVVDSIRRVLNGQNDREQLIQRAAKGNALMIVMAHKVCIYTNVTFIV